MTDPSGLSEAQSDLLKARKLAFDYLEEYDKLEERGEDTPIHLTGATIARMVIYYSEGLSRSF